MRLKNGYYLDYLYLTLFSGDKKCHTSSIYALYSGQSYIFEGPLLRDCQNFILSNNEYAFYVPMNSNAIETVSLYSSRFKMISPLHSCHFWYMDHLVYCSVSISLTWLLRKIEQMATPTRWGILRPPCLLGRYYPPTTDHIVWGVAGPP